jgi:DNA-binding transcriptional LysR family regulator
VPPAIAAASIRPAQLLALQVFDVAARTGSFRDAARSLNLTPSAISHRIRNLEAALGTALFTRTHRAVELNAEGKRLAAATGKAFAELARVGSPAPDRSRRLRLRLKVLPTFASAWLIPRMVDFINRHPCVDVAIETSSRNVDFDTEAFDERERSGAIVRPLALAYPTGSYWLVYPKGQRRNRALEAFRRWLLKELGK